MENIPDKEEFSILLVEDDLTYARFFQITLSLVETARFRVTIADSLGEASVRIGEGAFDLIVLDLSLPDTAGFSTFLKLRAIAADLPVIVLTVMDDERIAHQAVAAGAQDYLVKDKISNDLLVRALVYAITRHRQAAELERMRRRQLQLEEARYEIVVRLIDEGVLVVDRDSVIRYCNESAERILRVAASSACGTQVRAIIDDEAWRLFIQSMEDGASECAHARLTLARGEEMEYIDIHGEAIRLSGGERDGYVYMLSDVTDFMRTAQLKSNLVGFVSHELRGPLTIIKGSASAILTFGLERLKEGAIDFIRDIDVEAERLERLVNSFLNLSRIEGGIPLEVRHEQCDPRQLIAQAGRCSNVDVSSRAIDVEIDEHVTSVRGDGDMLTEILTNLISNAIKYSPDGERVQIRIAPDGDCVGFEVIDRGCGIPEEARRNLFAPFFRAATKIPGAGLGLYISRHLVEAHNGTMSIDSHEGRGTRVRFTIPA